MGNQKKIILPVLLLLVLLPTTGRPSEIRQERYGFQMELTQNIARETFVIGEFPVLAALRPPAAATTRNNAGPPLALRVSGNSEFRRTSSGPFTDENDRCSFPAVLFARGSAEISRPARKTFTALLAECTARDTPLVVTGYTCDLNSQKLNDALALQRAESVAELLRQYGFIVSEVRGKGKSDYRTTDPGKRYLNRRVEIKPADKPHDRRGTL